MRDTEVLVTLRPGFWQDRIALAWSYIRLGEDEKGLEIVAVTKQLGEGASQSHLVPYVEAVALRNLGRTEEAIEAAVRSMGIRPSAAAQQLLRDLGVEAQPAQ